MNVKLPKHQHNPYRLSIYIDVVFVDGVLTEVKESIDLTPEETQSLMETLNESKALGLVIRAHTLYYVEMPNDVTKYLYGDATTPQQAREEITQHLVKFHLNQKQHDTRQHNS